MKDKLKLEQLAHYFPYDLECKILNYQCDYVGEPYGYVKGYYMLNNEPHYMFKGRDTSGKDASLIQPIFHPLSDLPKPIIIEGYNGGKEFVPMDVLYELFDGMDYSEHFSYLKQWANNNVSFLHMPFDLAEQLFQWHFWIFDQEDFGKTIIDINTL